MILGQFKWKIQVDYYISNAQIYCNILEVMKQVGSFLTLTNPLFYELKHSLFPVHQEITQPAITCSKLTIETLEQGVKYVQS